MTGEKLACHVLPGTCAGPKVTVYHGQAKATIMCDHHSSNIRPEDFAAMREAGTISEF